MATVTMDKVNKVYGNGFHAIIDMEMDLGGSGGAPGQRRVPECRALRAPGTRCDRAAGRRGRPSAP
jgi:hypothetical protein